MWRMFLNGDWGGEKGNKWRVAQFLFPILAGTSVGLATQYNYACLPMLAASMWKLGFSGECREIFQLHINLQVLTLCVILFYLPLIV